MCGLKRRGHRRRRRLQPNVFTAAPRIKRNKRWQTRSLFWQTCRSDAWKGEFWINSRPHRYSVPTTTAAAEEGRCHIDDDASLTKASLSWWWLLFCGRVWSYSGNNQGITLILFEQSEARSDEDESETFWLWRGGHSSLRWCLQADVLETLTWRSGKCNLSSNLVCDDDLQDKP